MKSYHPIVDAVAGVALNANASVHVISATAARHRPRGRSNPFIIHPLPSLRPLGRLVMRRYGGTPSSIPTARRPAKAVILVTRKGRIVVDHGCLDYPLGESKPGRGTPSGGARAPPRPRSF